MKHTKQRCFNVCTAVGISRFLGPCNEIQHACPFRLQEAQVVSLLLVEARLHRTTDAEARDTRPRGFPVFSDQPPEFCTKLRVFAASSQAAPWQRTGSHG